VSRLERYGVAETVAISEVAMCEVSKLSAGGAFSSMTTDCLFARCSSSSSSVISIKRRLRSELVDEEVEPEAVCKEQAAESFESLRSFAFVSSKMVSWGVNLSIIALNCTPNRTTDKN